MVLYNKIEIDISSLFRLVHTAAEEKNIAFLKKKSEILFDHIDRVL
ncbi:hypothetical protein [Nitratifractor sp.]